MLKKIKTRRGQMEIMGLLVIVMIFIVALMFVLFFVARGDRTDAFRAFDDELHAYNTISTIVQAHTPCRSLTVTDVLKFASFGNNWPGARPCPEEGIPMAPETYATEQIETMLNRSLGFIEQDYHFYVYRDQDVRADGTISNYVIDIVSRKDVASAELCADYVVSGTQPISYQGGTFFVTLDICDKR
ncbi:hypothetical protein GF371_00380 [Candidatus Woesearchaeota archaeon]|nr:hypothetical protein [Candidatus Woesearchaeota archaeon]